MVDFWFIGQCPCPKELSPEELWEQNRNNHGRDKESSVTVQRGKERRKAPQGPANKVVYWQDRCLFLPSPLFLSHAHKHAHLMIAGKQKHRFSCSTK